MNVRRRHAAAAAVATICASLAAACIIADPSTDFPLPPDRRPTIIRDHAVPPTSRVLGDLPPNFTFLIDVEADPTKTVYWHLFVDYDDFHQNGPPAGLVGRDKSDPQIGADAGVRQIALQPDIPFAPDPGRCHVIEALVALSFQFDVGAQAHAFKPPGGDSIVWFYSPTGDLSGCPVFDAGIDGGSGPDSAGAPKVTEGGGGSG